MSKGSPLIRVDGELKLRLDAELKLMKQQQLHHGRPGVKGDELTYSDVISKLLDVVADHRQRARVARRGACLPEHFTGPVLLTQPAGQNDPERVVLTPQPHDSQALPGERPGGVVMLATLQANQGQFLREASHAG